eukprot:SM000091S24641  [mRNA]  locus=s91:466422:467975:- [translate_table: standard]
MAASPPFAAGFLAVRCPLAAPRPRSRSAVCAAAAGEVGSGDGEEPEVDTALSLKGDIPPTSDGFLRHVSSRAYDMRRRLEQSLEAVSYDVLEANPWRDDSKPVYVLAKEERGENKLYTMKTRRARSEVERELNLLFPGKRGSRRGKNGRPRGAGSKPSQEAVNRERESPPPTPAGSSNPSRFRMHVEDVREGVLVFEDENEAAEYCNLLDGGGHNCLGIAEVDASDVFAMCQKSRALAVLFRKGNTPPQPDRLKRTLTARKYSLED